MNDVKLCKKCREIMKEEDRPQGIYLYCWDYNDDELICDECQSKLEDVPISSDEYEEIVCISNTIGFLETMIKLKEKDPIEFQLKLSQFKTQTQQQEIIKQEKSSQVRCPKCKSTSITTGARGANGFWGFIGASQTVNRCANCGHTWKPRG